MLHDLEDLYDYIESHDAVEKADYVLDRIEKVFSSLANNPERGAFPNELLAVGLKEYRETYFKPYRIIYRIMDMHFFVMVIADVSLVLIDAGCSLNHQSISQLQ